MSKTKKNIEEPINEEVLEKEDYLEEVFEKDNMPNQNTINEWKKQFKDRIYSIKLTDKDVFIWRPLTRKEFKELNQLEADALTKEESLCEICILWPENYGADEIENGIAGAPTILAEHIMQTSGFNDSFVPIEL